MSSELSNEVKRVDNGSDKESMPEFSALEVGIPSISFRKGSAFLLTSSCLLSHHLSLHLFLIHSRYAHLCVQLLRGPSPCVYFTLLLPFHHPEKPCSVSACMGRHPLAHTQ